MGRNFRVCLSMVWLAVGLAMPTVAAQQVERPVVAEGEYSTMKVPNTGGETVEFREVWKLTRTSKNSYEAESVARFRSSKTEDVAYQIRLTLSPTLHPVAVKIFGGIPSLKGYRSMVLEFTEHELRCCGEVGKVRLKIDSPYDLYFPTPWFFSSIVRRAERNKERGTAVRLVFMDKSPDNDTPVGLAPFEGQVRYLGSEQVKLAGETWNAEKFLIQPGPFTPVSVWLSPEGLMLAMEDAKNPEQRIELVRYKKYANF